MHTYCQVSGNLLHAQKGRKTACGKIKFENSVEKY